MSYILTALRKSEAERAKGMVPRFSTRHEPETAPGRRGRLWPLVAVTALVVNCVLVAVVLLNPAVLPWLSGQQPSAVSQPVAVVPDAVRSIVSSAPQVAAVQAATVAADDRSGGMGATGTQPAQDTASDPAEDRVQEVRAVGSDSEKQATRNAGATPAEAAVRRSPEPAQAAGAKTPLVSAAAPSGTGLEQQAPGKTMTAERTQTTAVVLPQPAMKKPPSVTKMARSPTPATEVTQAASTKPAPEVALAPSAAPAEQLAALPEQSADPYLDVPELWRMPRDFRASVPEFSISVHVYAPEDKHRFIIVDRKKYVEGDQIKSGVTIEAILPAGVVFDLKGQQFKLTNS